MLQQSAVGPAPSPLLLSYLRYAIKTSLVSGTRFFQALCEVANPSCPLQFSAFLDLVVEFAPTICSDTPHLKAKGFNLRASTERLGRRTVLTKSTDGDARLTKRSKDGDSGTRSLAGSQIIPSLSSSTDGSSFADESATKKLQEDVAAISQVCLSIAIMLVKGLEYSLTYQSSGGKPSSDMGRTSGFSEQVNENMSTCIDALVVMLSGYRTLGFLLTARAQQNGTATPLTLSISLTQRNNDKSCGFRSVRNATIYTAWQVLVRAAMGLVVPLLKSNNGDNTHNRITASGLYGVPSCVC